MTQNQQTADAYYNLMYESLGYIVEDKSVKNHAQAFQLLKKDIEKFAKENNLECACVSDSIPIKRNTRWSIFSHSLSKDSEVMISLSGNSLPTPKIINISTCRYGFSVALPPNGIGHDEIVFNSISDSKYKGAFFVVNWLIKDPTKDNLAMLLETVTRMKLNFIACEWNEQIRADAQNK